MLDNYAVKMYENVGFIIVDENDEEYIMVCELQERAAGSDVGGGQFMEEICYEIHS